jgi:hypothetical protein
MHMPVGCGHLKCSDLADRGEHTPRRRPACSWIPDKTFPVDAVTAIKRLQWGEEGPSLLSPPATRYLPGTQQGRTCGGSNYRK